MRTILLFPPNWSACVSGPHLALPLLAGTARTLGLGAEIWDLSDEFYGTQVAAPPIADVIAACGNEDFDCLDDLYFRWEDQFRPLCSEQVGSHSFRLLSGFQFPQLRTHGLSDVVRFLVGRGTVYTRFLSECCLPALAESMPDVVAVTIASENQVVPAVELLLRLRQLMPDTFTVLGGNVVTRLRDSAAFRVLTSLADLTVIFQGEVAFARALRTVSEVGPVAARERLSGVLGDESITCNQWPVPSFAGYALQDAGRIAVIPYVSTRGCYWGRCRFCAIPAGWSSSGYAGSAPAAFAARQIHQMVTETGVPRVKFVDETFPSDKVLPLCAEFHTLGLNVEWEAYARLEPPWENAALLHDARAAGLRKLYFGLEQAPGAKRSLLGKCDSGDPLRILQACRDAGVRAHLFCMVGFPGTSRDDAFSTIRFLVDNQHLIDTADLVGFRLERGVNVQGVRPKPPGNCDWQLSLPYETTEAGALSNDEVHDLEVMCQEQLWQAVPRLLHPLYRMVGPWDSIPLPTGHARPASRVPSHV